MSHRAVGQGLELIDLTKQYGANEPPAVDHVTLTVRPGEFLALLGASGSGKTTTLMLVAGFVEPTSGDIRVGGSSLLSIPPERRGLGVVFQNYALFPHMSVFDNVAFPLEMRRESRDAIRHTVGNAIKLVGLNGLDRRYPHQLSGGQQQRVALARAIVFSPPVLLMDEPLGALDKQLREQMQRELRVLHRELGSTVVYVTHDQREALTLADRVGVMNNGRIEQLDAPDTLYRFPANRFVASFIGDCNFLAPDAFSHREAAWRVAFGDWGGESSGPGPADDSRPLLAVRPHQIHLGSPHQSQGISGRVVDAVYIGESIEYQVDCGERGMLVVRRPATELSEGAAIGAEVCVTWSWSETRVL
jgi:ABC-type Fe3+/spermidine/putrescine transport system ATPase subunit